MCMKKLKGRLVLGFVAILLGLFEPIASNASNQNPNTNFMSGHYGIMTYLAPQNQRTVDNGGTIGVWNTAANNFNLTNFVNQVRNTGASFVVFEVGQNWGFYYGGNSSFESLAHVPAGSRVTTRDLVKDMATALNAVGIKLIVYIPSGPAIYDTPAANGLGFFVHAGGDSGVDWFHSNSTQDDNWAAALRGWATHYGTLVSGWWMDGFYGPCCGHAVGVTQLSAQKFADALHAGNPNAVVGFNDWTFGNPTAGPVADYATAFNRVETAPSSRWFDNNGTQIQWNESIEIHDGKFTNDQLGTYTRQVTSVGGSLAFQISMDVGGNLNPPVYNQMLAVKAIVFGGGIQFDPNKYYKITNHTSGQALDNQGSQTEGSLIKQWSDVSSPNLEWQVVNLWNGYYKIKNHTSGQVLDSQGSQTEGSFIKQWSDVSSPNLEWEIIAVGNGYYKIKNHTSGQVLDNQGSQTEGSFIKQWSDVSSPNLEWTFTIVN